MTHNSHFALAAFLSLCPLSATAASHCSCRSPHTPTVHYHCDSPRLPSRPPVKVHPSHCASPRPNTPDVQSQPRDGGCSSPSAAP
eukprot:1758745-Prymnesium_polylepis.2